MSTARLPTKFAEKDDLLVPFEQQVLPQEYQQYYRTTLNNFFASIQKFPELWDYYMMLDQIWFREIDVLKPSDPNNKTFPINTKFGGKLSEMGSHANITPITFFIPPLRKRHSLWYNNQVEDK